MYKLCREKLVLYPFKKMHQCTPKHILSSALSSKFFNRNLTGLSSLMNSSSKRSYSFTQNSSSFQMSCEPRCSLWVFSNCCNLVYNFQVVATCSLIGPGTRDLVLWCVAPRDPIHPPRIAPVFKTKCKPKWSLWVFSDCYHNLANNFHVVAACLQIWFWIIIPGSMNSNSKRYYS
jgi:hypothetical protein